MKILLITDEVWNNRIHGNNVLSNWFDGFDAEFANIYCSPGLPFNECCERYFQITDGMMINSILKNKRAGKILSADERDDGKGGQYISTDVNVGWLKKYFPHVLRLLKEIVWSTGKYDTDKLKNFILDFKPDIIFSARFAKKKILRLEKIVYDIADCPIVAFTGDNEYSLRMFYISPIAWINKFIQRRTLRKMMPYYSEYFTLSEEQKEEYEKNFGCKMQILRKVGDFSKPFKPKRCNKPIKLVYAGKLYCNRWKTLAEVADAAKRIDGEGKTVRLHIYTSDALTEKQKRVLQVPGISFVHPPVPQQELVKIYEDADIALHVESFDLKNRLLTRVSFSTKIIDCLSSTCAVAAICWREHSGFTYLKRNDAAFCIDDVSKIYGWLKEITENPSLITSYQKKAYECGKRFHNKSDVQKQLYNELKKIIK